MSDSAEGNVSQGGPKPGGEDVGLKPEDAERYAAAFVPVWQFDEAPFAAGARMSASDLQELGAPSGVGSGRTLVDGPSPVVAPTASDPAGATEKVATVSEALASVLVAPPDSAPATPASPAPPESAPASPVRAATRSTGAGPRLSSSPTPAAGMPAVRLARSRPAPAREQLDDVDPFPKPSSNRNLFVGAGVAVVVVIGAILALRGGSTAAPAPASPTVAAPHPTEESHIPPPPPAADTAAATAAAAPEPPPPPAAQPAAPAPPAVTTAPPPPAPATAAAAAPTVRPPVTQRSDILRPPSNRGSTSKPSTKPGSGGIVRDNPF